DDAIRACNLITRALADGIAAGQQKVGAGDFRANGAVKPAEEEVATVPEGDYELLSPGETPDVPADPLPTGTVELEEGGVGTKNDEFQAFAKKVLETVEAGGTAAVGSLDEERAELSGKLGENISVVGAARFEAVDGGRIAAYAHPPANKIGVLLQLRGGDADLGRKLAMHIAASQSTPWIGREDGPE